MMKNVLIGLVVLIVLGIAGVFLSKGIPHPGTAAVATQEQAAPVTAAAADSTVPAPPPPAAAAPEASPEKAVEAPAAAPAPQQQTAEPAQASPALEPGSLATMTGDRFLGNANAPVTIIEYASLTCPHCAHFTTQVLPEVKKRLIDTGKAKLIFRDFPLDQFALKAAMMARCLPPEKYFNIIEVIFSNQERWTKAEDPLKALAQLGGLAGMDDAAFQSCTQNSALEAAILAGVQDAQTKYKIQSTPSFVFNDGADQLSGAQDAGKFEAIVNKLSQGK